jgi:hypothetical protein
VWKWLSLAIVAVLAAGAGCLVWSNLGPDGLWPHVETLERTEYHPPKADAEEILADDRLEDKTPAFDPSRVDRRPLGPKNEWRLNASAAVLRLDVPLIRPDQEPNLLTLHPSYAAAVQAASGQLLLSVNLLDGKAKQFDDGLYAALDQAYYRGVPEHLTSHVQLIRRLYDKTDPGSPSAPFLAAGLELAGVKVEVADGPVKDQWLAAFEANPVASKPIGFYTWNETLKTCFRFLRFFQREFGPNELAVPQALARTLASDPALLADYRKAMDFFARLTNPYSCLSVADVVDVPNLTPAVLVERCEQKKITHKAVSLFPPSTSRETELFDRLFPLGLPENVDLMRELVRRIRSGEVNLQPRPNSGWYDHQVYALETLLLPEKGEERDKLLLTRAYKKRMLEAFQALITKRRETHVRQLKTTMAAAAPLQLPDKVKPRLRVEPCPSYYLRTARAYAFLANFLEAALGPEPLQTLHGLRQDGPRAQSLHDELRWMRELFYGLYLVSAEDIGLKPAITAEEAVDQEHCYRLATDWLPKALGDRDLAADTRVAVPIAYDPVRKATRLWLTLGVRLAKLDASYARPPHLKPAEGGEWKEVEPHRLEGVQHVIPVDEFAEVELRRLNVLTREELRAVCDREKTKDAILQALRK